MGRRQKGRNVHGILLLDKPLGVGSNAVLQRLKRLYRARKAGHTGSLDRQASGLLPICFGEATKLSGFLLDADKRYEAVLHLGVKTNTGDTEGEVIQERAVPALSRHDVEQVLETFRGEIEQIPPMHSALKIKGQRLYKLAHQGLVVERKARPVTIKELKLTEMSENRVGIEVFCSKGTYIRTLGEDIGDALGCGAHLAALRRTASGPFAAEQMVTLAALEQPAEEGMEALDKLLLPMDTALPGWPDVNLSDDMAYYLRQGQAILVPHAPTRGWVRIYAGKACFLGVGEVQADGKIAPRKLLATN